MFEFLKRESPPIVIGHSPPAPSTVSSSYVSDVTNIDHDKKENGCQEEVSSPSQPSTCSLLRPTITFSVVNYSSGKPVSKY
ncbi:hypothetical protein NL676_009168 [Syzygium grande]|nr:hypothetical protein NL676_009168 [Syzygium grande]